ncbi:peptidase T [Ichthyobacterium seriolicida]|uniref:Peptidase T n=1 Tax=Ichthyobacterium seriolicida TaxID=242600 RepID=A0A1J1E709_9FLAO|nr:peptidase T [Ichthyobacterium seriolicida]BAV95126.1 peptidase T [Ichthyobacterium seriolicida]
MKNNMKPIVKRFFKYLSFHTESKHDVDTIPSTERQFQMGNYLVDELKSIGLKEVEIDENCYVMATLPSNTEKNIPVIGFVAHIDTSPDFTGKNVNPKITYNYDGGDIILNTEKNIILSAKYFPEIKLYKNQTIITTDGTTLLGADDKAGVTEIVTAMEYLINNPDIKHGEIRICFTPDEEVGKGADLFDVEKFRAKWAYTIDGDRVGKLEFENFNAATAIIDIKGNLVHPGFAKDKMVNANTIASEFSESLPKEETPENTQGYEGFYHLCDINGNVETARLRYIIRDHDHINFTNRKNNIEQLVNDFNKRYNNSLTLEMKDQYYNMKEKIEPIMYIVDIAKEAMEKADIKPIIEPIRGGTDGCRLSYMGLPCPNIFSGGHNFHSKYEYIAVESMEKAVEVIVNIASIVENKFK